MGMTAIIRFIFLVGLLFCLCLPVSAQANEATVVRRAGFDIGAAAIKCTVADVDIATGRILKIVAAHSEKVNFAEDISRSYDNNLSKEVMDHGIAVLEKLKSFAVQNTALEYSAVGGKTFQTARNGRAYFARIKKETGIPARIISEQQAAMLNYHAARQALGNSNNYHLLVWDIGGSSMRMALRREDGGLFFYLDPLSSVSFKKMVIGSIQHKDTETTKSPNPIQPSEVEEALAFDRSHATMTVPAPIVSRLRHSDIFVAGVGGVHYYAIPEMLGERKASYTRDEVAAALKRWTGKKDADFNSEYADTRLTNLILVLGYMDVLGIKEIHPLKINQANGMFAAREFW